MFAYTIIGTQEHGLALQQNITLYVEFIDANTVSGRY